MLTSLKRRLKLPIQSPSTLMTVSRNMDDLWDPPNYQVTEDTNCINDGCQCTSCLTNDVAEETALNELSCIEVLRTLNSKADTDIIELEEELMDLLIQFVCTDKEFSDMFSMCLRREIGFLNQSIRKIKDDTEHDLSTSRKPADSMLDILDSLFCLYIQKKDNKCADNINNAASSSCQVQSDIPFRETNKQTTTSSNDNQLEKNKTIINTSLEKHRFSQIRVKAEDPDANYPYTGLDRVSMENLKHHQLIKIKCQTDEESTGSKSTHSIDSPTPNTQINSHEFQQPNVTLSLSSNNTYKTTQTLDSPLLLEEGADVALDIDCYKVGDLRAIAKQRGFKGYSKLRKLELAQALGIKIVEGKRKQKRKETLALTLT